MNTHSNKTFSTNHWSGGTTTEVLIYPKESSYERRNFLWRISEATITHTHSTFTPLPHYFRKTLVLEGTLFLSHHEQPYIKIPTFSQATYAGDAKTKSIGIVKNLNIIYEPSLCVHMQHFYISNKTYAFSCFESEQVVLYALDILHIYEHSKHVATIHAGEIFYISKNTTITLNSNRTLHFIQIKIH